MNTSIERTKRSIEIENAIRAKTVSVGPAMKELHDLAIAEKNEGNNGICEVARFNRLYKNIADDAAQKGNSGKFLSCAEKYGFSEIK